MLKKLIFSILILLSVQVFAADRYYLNAADTSDAINTTIKSAIDLIKQNVKNSNFNTLYAMVSNQKTIICGSFQTLSDKTPTRFIISPKGSLVTEQKIKNKKDFEAAWVASCK